MMASNLLMAFCLLFLLVAQCTMAHGEEEENHPKKMAASNRRHSKSRHRGDAATAECIQGYKQRIEHHCRYPSTEQPCFQQTVPEWAQAVEETSKNCCSGTGLCSVEDFEGLCCRTPECLEKCYGKPFLQRFRDRFRYLDILLHAHPENQQNGRAAGRHMDLAGQLDLAALDSALDEVESGLAEVINEVEEEKRLLAKRRFQLENSKIGEEEEEAKRAKATH